jgi:hypothetical protein
MSKYKTVVVNGKVVGILKVKESLRYKGVYGVELRDATYDEIQKYKNK